VASHSECGHTTNVGCRFDGIKQDLYDLIGDGRGCNMNVCIDEEMTVDGCLPWEFIDHWGSVSKAFQPIFVASVVGKCTLAENRWPPLPAVILDEIGIFEVADDVIECRTWRI
jgi:hypothetical protein